MALTQLGFDAGIQQQPNALTTHRPQRPIPRRDAIEGVALHVMNALITPVERSPIHHIGMGDQASTGGSKQPGAGQSVAGKTTNFTTNPGGKHQQGRRWGTTGP